MGAITSGVGLISGIDIAGLIENLISLESRGKFRIQEQIGTLQAQQTALLDVNARLLAFKSASGAFRTAKTFQSVLATSSNAEVLGATADTSAQPGSFKFIVKQLVSTSQMLSRGFESAAETPLGLSSMSFEFGNGSLAVDRSLEDLNGGLGIDRGEILITDRSGATATIDLTDVTNVAEVLQRINASEDVNVTASVEDDHFVITDTSGGAGALTVANTGSDTTASDLGIAGTAAGATLTGTGVFALGSSTALSSLNDGNGVLIRNNVADLLITARNGTSFEVDFGRIDQDITDATLLEDLNDGAGISIDDDTETADIKFVDRDGVEHEIDLTGVTTVGGLRTRISAETGGAITLEVTDGDHFKVVDNTGGSAGNLKIQGSADNGTTVAEELGILNEDGVAAAEYEGEVIPSTIDQAAVTSLQDVIDRINDSAGNPGVVASIAPDGLRIRLEDATGAGNLIVASTAANPNAASDLGIETAGAGAVFDGERLIGGLGSVLADSINGGGGLGGATSITISDRDDISLTLNNLDLYETLDEIIVAINDEAVALGVQARVSLNDVGNGLQVIDTSGGAGNLTISGDAAAALGLEADVADDVVRGDNVQLQYVSGATALADLNYGQGIGTGAFKITDGLGNSATVSIGGDEETLYDVILEINSKGLAVRARVNDNGDGLIIEEDPAALGGDTPFVPIKVESTGGTAAADLNITGTSDDVAGGFIDGSYEAVVTLSAGDTLGEVADKINDAGIEVSATVVNTGAGATPYHLSFTSNISGRSGRLMVDSGGVDLGLTVLTAGDDAKVFFGSDDPATGLLLTSSSNTLDDVIEGVTIDLLAASDDPVTITIERDEIAVVNAVQQMVDTFNGVIQRIAAYDFYDTESEERGLLLGDPTTARIRSSLYRTAAGKANNVEGNYQYLVQVGIRFDSDGEMTFDQAKFMEAYESDPESVEALFATYDISVGGSEQIAEGVTVETTGTTYNALGFGNMFDRLLEDLTNTIDGTTTLARNAYQSRIDLLEDRIETIDDRLEARRNQLLNQFTAMETALAQLQNQSQALSSITSLISS